MQHLATMQCHRLTDRQAETDRQHYDDRSR